MKIFSRVDISCGEPIMPGTLIVEALAQMLGSLLPHWKSSSIRRGRLRIVGGINKAHFLEFVRPGDTLFLNFDIQKVQRTSGNCQSMGDSGG